MLEAPIMRLVRSTDDLAALTAELRQRPFVAVDTEFMRERTYWPILCLVQAAAEGVEGVIDPMADGIDLAPLLDLMADDRVVKVFHAARQDVEIFHRLMGKVPEPIFDTQIAAMACGFGEQIGYEPLVRTLLGAQIDKGSRFTDWSRRPLSDAQLTYALSDVTYLRDAYPMLAGKLSAGGRARWVEEEMRALADPGLYRTEPVDAWKRLKIKGVRPGDIGPIIKLAEWREREAQEKDLPRGRVLKDEAIFELARLKPSTPEQLSEARSIPSGYERSRAGAAMIAAIAAGRALSRSDLPDIERPARGPTAPADVVELLKVLLRRQCDRAGIAPRLVASVDDLESIALGRREAPALSGWRREIFGETAERLIDGSIAMRLKDGDIELIESA